MHLRFLPGCLVKHIIVISVYMLRTCKELNIVKILLYTRCNKMKAKLNAF